MLKQVETKFSRKNPKNAVTLYFTKNYGKDKRVDKIALVPCNPLVTSLQNRSPIYLIFKHLCGIRPKSTKPSSSAKRNGIAASGILRGKSAAAPSPHTSPTSWSSGMSSRRWPPTSSPGALSANTMNGIPRRKCAGSTNTAASTGSR